jgi:hypothetical protein
VIERRDFDEQLTEPEIVQQCCHGEFTSKRAIVIESEKVLQEGKPRKSEGWEYCCATGTGYVCHTTLIDVDRSRRE